MGMAPLICKKALALSKLPPKKSVAQTAVVMISASETLQSRFLGLETCPWLLSSLKGDGCLPYGKKVMDLTQSYTAQLELVM